MPIVAGLAGIAWLSAFVHGLMLLSHRRDEHSLGSLMFHGHLFFSRDTWKPSGHAIHRRFLGSALAFFAIIMLGVVAGIATAAISGG